MSADEVGPVGLRQAFWQKTGHDPEGLWRAPGRVNLIGEHTDYNDGYVLPLGIDRETRVAGRRRSDRLLRAWSLQKGSSPVFVSLDELTPGAVTGWGAYVVGTAWALNARAGSLAGADLVIDSNVPVGAGLSSSAALEMASGLAMAHLSETHIDLQDLALAAQKAENDFVGVPCGIMDQLVSALAAPGHSLFIDTRTLEVRHVPFDPGRSAAALMVIDTRTAHSLADGEYAARRRGCEEAARTLGVGALRDVSIDDLEEALGRLSDSLAPLVRHVVTENQRVLATAAALHRGDLQAAGGNMNASHESLRDDFRVSSPELNLAVDTCRLTGAYGARMTGAGFGGSAIALASSDIVDSIQDQIRMAFNSKGMPEPAFFEVKAAAGCSRIWP